MLQAALRLITATFCTKGTMTPSPSRAATVAAQGGKTRGKAVQRGLANSGAHRTWEPYYPHSTGAGQDRTLTPNVSSLSFYLKFTYVGRIQWRSSSAISSPRKSKIENPSVGAC